MRNDGSLSGSVALEGVSDPCHAHLSVVGNASPTRITLDSRQLCRFDLVPFRLELAR